MNDNLVKYTTDGDPSQNGVYAVRVPVDHAGTLLEDKFLLWMDGTWWHRGSDTKFRGEVIAWLGPLQRRLV